MSITKEDVDIYVRTVDRMEPDIAHVDESAVAASLSISMRRIADAAEKIEKHLETIVRIQLGQD